MVPLSQSSEESTEIGVVWTDISVANRVIRVVCFAINAFPQQFQNIIFNIIRKWLIQFELLSLRFFVRWWSFPLKLNSVCLFLMDSQTLDRNLSWVSWVRQFSHWHFEWISFVWTKSLIVRYSELPTSQDGLFEWVLNGILWIQYKHVKSLKMFENLWRFCQFDFSGGWSESVIQQNWLFVQWWKLWPSYKWLSNKTDR
jgi:hypothetical protein